MKDIMNCLQEDIQNADMVLIGVGHELSAVATLDLEEYDFYRDNKNKIKEDSMSIFEDICRYKYTSENLELIELFNQLERRIGKKNYFIFTSNTDQSLTLSTINQKRVVAPCGSITRLQCGCDTEESIKDVTDYYRNCIDIINNENKPIDLLKEMPKCDICGEVMYPNTYKAEKYNENGYLKQWDFYNKWLQGTLNKNLVILELGEGFQMPALMRWPFEKITFINQKAKLYRVNKTFYQLPENLSEKGVAVKCDSRKFLEDLFL